MKRISLALLLTLVALVGLAGCGMTNGVTPLTEDDVYSLSIISVGDLLAQSQVNTTSSSMSVETDLETDPVTDEPVTETDPVLEKYLLMVETFLNSSAPLNVITAASDRIEYAYMTTYETKDVFGEIVSYTIYFNEVIIEAVEPEDETEDPVETENESTTASVNENKHGDRNRDYDHLFDDENEDVIETELEGLLIVNGVEYILLGRREVKENETEYKFIALIDELNFIRISYESEDDEQKFKFVHMVDGVIVNRTSIKVENENVESKVMLVYQTETIEARYSFKYVDNEDYDLFIKYEIDENGSEVERGMIKIKINVDEVTGETTYTYQIVGERQGHGFGKDHEFERGHHGQSNDSKGQDDKNEGNWGHR
jgi:hypothetical protein